MNQTTIEWTDRTWNPVTGCTKGCPWCYANRLARGRLRKTYLANSLDVVGPDPTDPFAPRFWRDRLLGPGKAKTPLKIFTCSMGELFDPHVPAHWIDAVLTVAAIHTHHTFQFLTQRPRRAARFHFPPNAWVGITMQNSDLASLTRLARFAALTANTRFLSYEPLIGPINDIPPWIDWIIIGAMTGPNAITPNPTWINRLLYIADKHHIPVFLKDNLNWPVHRQDWPKGV